uniref:Homeobox domain-containing protein n=1 Tax=Acanthochromis polyacanthus TaxID=80966 RepID=A0A3Q1FV62_9TELE
RAMANFSVEWLSKSYYEDLTARRCSFKSPKWRNLQRNQQVDILRLRQASKVGDDSEVEAAQQRRLRTKSTSEQIGKLENTFRKHRYLGATQRRRIKCCVSQVKTWFQNRRMKLKREVQDIRPDFLVPAALLPPPLLFQHPLLGGQLPSSSGFYRQLQPLHRTAFPAALYQQHRSLPSSPPLPRLY